MRDSLSMTAVVLPQPEPLLGELAPELQPGGEWFNGPPLTLAALRGRVVLVNFWVHSCSNCHGSLPFVRELAEGFADGGLTVVGVHTPELDSDYAAGPLRDSMSRDGVSWPVVQDNDFATWRSYQVRAWPTFVFVDRSGNVRGRWVGEISDRFPGGRAPVQQTIESLLSEPSPAGAAGQ